MSGLVHDHSQWPHRRWGAGDQIGAGNLLTVERRLAALRSGQSGRLYDLSHEISANAPYLLPNQTPYLLSIWASFRDSIRRRQKAGATNDAGTNLERVEMTMHVGTHIDALGHFSIGDPGSAGLSLQPDSRQFVVIEGKLFNRLAVGVKNAPYFDQAARSVACIAESLRRAGREPGQTDDLAFLVLAPRARIDDGVFAWDTTIDAIRRKVRRRVEDYAGERDAWFHDWFEPTLERIDVRSLSWEDLVDVIAFHDPESGQLIDSFYGKCLRFNRPQALARFPGRRSAARAPDWSPSP